MTDHGEAGKIYFEPPAAGTEAATLLGSLERQRATFVWKCAELGPAGLRATVGTSSMTLGGLLKHLALVEDSFNTEKLRGRELGPPWDTIDWDADRDWEWHSAADDTPEQLYDLWRAAVDRSRAATTEALASGGLAGVVTWGWPDGSSPSLRRLLVDVIEEYARHVGHADLIREAIDGRVGEDPPWTRAPMPDPADQADSYLVHPIGRVSSELVDVAAAPNQGDQGAPDAWLVIDPEVREGIRDIRAGAELLVLTWLHRSRRDELSTVPGDDPGGPERGVFSTRSPARPNPVGLHRVTVLAVEDGRLGVTPLEAVDGTPLVDIKPVIRPYER
jgi:tRNA-Thr(GGU) m(6)t(6)A37 methyltransferase TsaA